jgi:hypothetical protein
LSSRCRPAQLVAILEDREDELEQNSKDQTAAGRRGNGRSEKSSPIVDWVRSQISPFAFEKFLAQYNRHAYYVVDPASAAGAWQVCSPNQGGLTHGQCPSSNPGSVPDAPAAGGHRLVVQISDQDNGMLYKCTCGDDVIYGLPCRHILAVWAKTISPKLPSVAVLHPFWRNHSTLPAESALTALHMASEIRRHQMGHTSSAEQSDAGSQLTLSQIMAQSQDGTEMVRNFCSPLTSSTLHSGAIGPAVAAQSLLPTLAFSPADYTACSSEVLRNLQQIVDRHARGPTAVCIQHCQELLHEMFQMLDKYQTIAQSIAVEQSVRALHSPRPHSGAADSVGVVDTIVNPVPANSRGRPSSNALSFGARSGERSGRRSIREAVQCMNNPSRSDELGASMAPASVILPSGGANRHHDSSSSSSAPGRKVPSEGTGTSLHQFIPPSASVDLEPEEPVAKRTRKSHKCSACGSSDHQSNNRMCPVRRQLRDRSSRRGDASTGTSAA